MNEAGFERRNKLWLRTRREYNLGLYARSVEQWRYLESLYEVVDGAWSGFLLKDPIDSAATASEGVLAPWLNGDSAGTVGLGYGVPVHRLHKRYTFGARSHDRLITRPQSAISLLRGGSPVTIGSGAGNAAIDYDTGTVTFVADSSQSIQSVTVGAATVLNFSNGTGVVDEFVAGQRIYITGVSGTAASTLNSLSHVISSIGATSITIATSTTGLTATGGTAYKYPQASEALAWSGSFYVPVRFLDDDLDWELVAGGPTEAQRLVTGPSIILVELREE